MQRRELINHAKIIYGKSIHLFSNAEIDTISSSSRSDYPTQTSRLLKQMTREKMPIEMA